MRPRDQDDEELEKRLNEILALRDEIRLKLHLASMDIQGEWEIVERTMPRGHEDLATLESARQAIDELIEKLRRFAVRLRYASDHETLVIPPRP